MQQKVILIAGGSAGIGLALVKKCLPTHHVVFTGRRDMPQLPESPNSILYARGDVADAAACAEWVHMAEKLGPLCAVVNAAGCNHPPHTVEDMPFAEWKDMLDSHLNGSFLLCKTAIPALRRHGPGASIVLVSSRSGCTGYAMPGMAHNKTKANYAAAKAGMMSLSRSLARELAPEGIRVNNVAPGPIHTDRTPAGTCV